MTEKRDPYSSYGQKLISVFAKLLFSHNKHSLTELSQMLRCSKQTILRVTDDIRRSYGIDIEETKEGKRKYYQIKKLKVTPLTLHPTGEELAALHMCRAFTENLLGRQLYEEATRALSKSQSLLSKDKALSSQYFGAYRPGTIDYTAHHDTLHTLIKAMDEKRVCKIIYCSTMSNKANTHYIKPFKLFSRRDSIYLHSRFARTPGKKYKKSEFDPLMAVHRIKKVDITDRYFELPKDYDFEKFFNQNFGLIKEDSFNVEVELSGYASRYASERIWSVDQKIEKISKDKIKLSFNASSEPEIISWVLSFGDKAVVIKPEWLIDKIKNKLNNMQNSYS